MHSRLPFTFVFSCILFVLFSLTSDASAAEKMKIIFDTDLAGDIDDAFAHALVQVSPEFEVLGITTCDGPADRRAKVSCRMLYEAGQENIPVMMGRVTRPEDRHPDQLIWGDGFTKKTPAKESAADFIIRMLRKYPGQVTIISVGPVTNLGDVITKDPEAWKMVKAVYAMFGSFYIGYDGGAVPDAEWNVKCDIPAAKKFVDSGVPIIYAGLDVTTTVKYNQDRRTMLFARHSSLTDAISGLYTLWAGNNLHAEPTLFDPVAVSMALNTGFVTTKPAHIHVDDKGFTVVDNSGTPNATIGVNIKREEFLNWLTGRLVQQNLGGNRQ